MPCTRLLLAILFIGLNGATLNQLRAQKVNFWECFFLIWTLRIFCILSFNNWIHLKEILCGLDVAEMKPLGFCSYRQDEDWYGESFRCLPTSEKLWVPTWNSLRSQFFSQLAPSWGFVSTLQAGKIRQHMAKISHVLLEIIEFSSWKCDP